MPEAGVLCGTLVEHAGDWSWNGHMHTNGVFAAVEQKLHYTPVEALIMEAESLHTAY